MALRTTFIGPKEWRPRRNATSAALEEVECAGAPAGEEAGRVRYSRRVKGLSPSRPSLSIPVRRRQGESGGGGQPGGARGGADGEASSSSSRSSVSHSTVRSSRCSEHRRRLEAQIRAQEELDKIEEQEEELMRKRLQRKRVNVQRRLELELSSVSDEDIPSLSKASLPNQLESSRDRVTSWLTKSGSFSAKSGKNHRKPVPMRESTVLNHPEDENAKWYTSAGLLAESRVGASEEDRCAHRKIEVETTDANFPHRCGTDEMLKKLLSRQTISKDLPVFSGDVAEWPMFIAQFQRTRDLLGLSNEENLSRLQQCLRGKAREAVLPILDLPENVGRVISSLALMFGRPDQIIKALVQKVKDAESPKESRPESIILYSNLVANLVATMKSVNCTGHMRNPQMMEDLMGKLPTSLQYKWCSEVFYENQDATLEDLAKWLSSLADIASLMPTNPKDKG